MATGVVSYFRNKSATAHYKIEEKNSGTKLVILKQEIGALFEGVRSTRLSMESILDPPSYIIDQIKEMKVAAKAMDFNARKQLLSVQIDQQ